MAFRDAALLDLVDRKGGSRQPGIPGMPHSTDGSREADERP